jgi:hypothetical protein
VHTGALTAAVVGALLLGSAGGRVGVAAVTFPLQALLVLAWLAALGVQGLLGAAAVGVGAAAAADALLATGPTGVRRLVGVVAVALLVAMVQQLARGGTRPALTTSLASTVGAVALVAGFATTISLRRSTSGAAALTTALVATGIALVLARAVDAVRLRAAPPGARRRGWFGLVLAGVVAVGVGAIAGLKNSALDVGDGVALASAAAAIALAADIGLDLARSGLSDTDGADRTRAALLPLSVLLPVAAAAPAAYVTGRVLLG